MTNFDSFRDKLSACAVSFRRSPIDVDDVSKVRMLSSQRKFFSGLAYIGTQKQFAELSDTRVYAGTTIIACDSRTPILTGKSDYDGAAIIELTCGVADAFNTLMQILSAGRRQPLEDIRLNLLSVWDHIMTAKLNVNQDIKDHLAKAGVAVQDFFRILVVSLEARRVEESILIELRDRLDILLPQCEIFRYNNSLVILMFHSERVFMPELPEEALHELLSAYKASMMISYSMRDYSGMRTQFLLCHKSLELSFTLKEDPEDRILGIDGYIMYYIIDMCAQRCAQVFGHMDILLLVHPSIVNLRRYDVANKSNYIDILRHYLKNDGNITKTAKDMYMHRNTVINKVNKLKSMLPQNLENGDVRQRLIFACQTLEFYEKRLKYDIKKL